MANVCYGLSDVSTFFKYDLDTGSKTFPAASPVAFGGSLQLAWDGAKVYILGSDGKLYRYDPGSDSWSAALAGGVAITLGSNVYMTSDGDNVYINTGSFLYAYNIINDTLTVLGVFTEGFLIWDYRISIYSVSGSLTVDKINLGSRVITRGYPVTNYPGSSRGNAFAGGAWTNGKMFIYTQQAGYGGTTTGWFVTATDNGSSLAFGTPANHDNLQGQGRGTAVSPTLLYASTSQGGSYIVIINMATNTQTGIAGFGVLSLVYTTVIQTAFQFLEADGITPQASIESLTGDSYAYPTQLIGANQYFLKCVYPRSSVILAVAQDPTEPLAQQLQIATQLAGPYASSVNMGQFAAGQMKAYYLKAVVPTGFSPGTFFSSLTATAS